MKLQILPFLFVLTLFLFEIQPTMTLAVNNARSAEIYGVPMSGWASPQWNWGYAVGTGHDCAKICRNMFSSRESRNELIQTLIEPANDVSARTPPFEEVKLVLALAWQRRRGPYLDVLDNMASCKYEPGDERSIILCDQNLVRDMQVRYPLICEDPSDLQQMEALDVENADLDLIKRRCSGLVLKAMGFKEFGL